MAFVDSKMELTFSLRRKEIVEEEPLVADILKQWPAFFLEDQIWAEINRITQINLKSAFLPSLDENAPWMIKLYRVRGGVHENDMKTLLDQLDNQTSMFLQTFPEDFLDTKPEENHTKGMKMGILTIVEDDVATIHSNPNVRCPSLVLEDQVVLDNVQDLPTAMALLFGLIYALNMNYPKELKYTFERIQKVFIGLDRQCTFYV